MSGNHAERAHALLSASGSKRWMTCIPSAMLEEQFEDETSSFAEEGTTAHELFELHLALELKEITKRKHTYGFKKFKDNEYYSQEMEDHVQTCVDIVMERINEAKAKSKDAVVLIEQRLDYSEWVPEGFGTGDVVIIADGVLEIVDLKYGKGVPVSAVENTQMALYALGAINQFGMLYDFEKVRTTIVQPRLDSVSSEELDVDELLQWATETVSVLAEKAMKGEGDFVPGEHCRFCKARFTCKARADANFELLEYEFQDSALLSTEEVADVLSKVDELVKWAGEIKGFALDQAEKHGVKYPGFKLVEGRSNRIFTDKDAVIDTLTIEGFEEDKIYKPREIQGITALEKVIGKKQFNDLLSSLIIKPSGKPTLVTEDDKRPELNSFASAEADFANEDFDDAL
jgi:hypothetical protein